MQTANYFEKALTEKYNPFAVNTKVVKTQKDIWGNEINSISTKNYDLNGVVFPTLTLVLCLNNYLPCKLSNNDILLKPGNFVLINKGQKFSIYFNDEIESDLVFIKFSQDYLDEFLLHHLQEEDLNVLKLNNKSSQISFFDKTFELNDNLNFVVKNVIANSGFSLDFKTESNSLFFKFLSEILELHRADYPLLQKMPPVKLSTKIDLYKRLCIAKEYIDSNISAKLNLDEVASAACLSQFHFLRIFKSTFNETPHKYIVSRKLEKAYFLLKTSTLNFKEICFSVGFDSASSFGRLFKNRFGMSPMLLKSQI